ncbi:hypothetical protein PPACK8108_LOCUS25989 [Phakopsora pachyrhizi]|uniref:CCHC-type domain-containing protein n=1 Tax=Phakopsora pachyrhizi TaxID=170000 RepID=A0AAV0BVT1_PHAPC|nr:hypothetical protein PPACK8108_LOCUS25989 [Phakopsora pachyrhizi]
MPRAKSSQATVSNSSGHLTNDDYAIICAWLSKPSNYSSCFGKPGSTTIGQPPASKENGFNLMVNELNKKTKSGLHLTSKQMKDQFKTYQSQYGKAKKESSSTGFGLTEEDQSKGIIMISQKLNLMCPCYQQMDHIFGSLPNVNSIGGTSKLSSSIPRSSTEEQEGDNDDSQQVQNQGCSSSFFINLYPQHLNASFYNQPQPSYSNKAFQPEEHLYKPANSQIVGLNDNKPLLHPLTVRRCFNCGDPGHLLTGCPEPRNKSLIRLTKQIFQANNNNGAPDQSNSQQRPTQLLSLLTEATEETLKRRRFLALSFYPGVVSQALRPMPWFQLMEKWGYPLGYAIGSGGNGLDPFKAIKKRIEGSQRDDKWESTEILKMHKGRQSSSLLMTQEEADSDETNSDKEVLRVLLPNQKFRQGLGKAID